MISTVAPLSVVPVNVESPVKGLLLASVSTGVMVGATASTLAVVLVDTLPTASVELTVSVVPSLIGTCG